MKIALLFILIYIPSSFSASIESTKLCHALQSPICCDNCNIYEKTNKNAVSIQAINLQVRENNDILKSEKIRLKFEIQKLKSDVGYTKERTTELTKSMWKTLTLMSTIFFGVFGLGITLGGILIWRDHQINKSKLEIEVKEINDLKVKAKEQLDDYIALIIKDSNKEIKKEMSCIRRRNEVVRLIDSGSTDFDDYYPSVSYLAQFHSTENVFSLQKVEKVVLLNAKDKILLSQFIEKAKGLTKT